MEQETKYLQIDTQAIKTKIIVSGMFVVGFCFVISVLFASLFNYSNFVETITIGVLWISFLIMWATASILAWTKASKNKYILTDDSLIVKKYSLTGSSEQLYRYDSFLTIEVKKNMLTGNTGKIIITIPKIAEPLVLENIKNPNHQAESMKKHISSTTKDTKSLIN